MTKSKKGTNGESKEHRNGSAKSSGKTLDDLLQEGLRDIYSAETQLLKALPEAADAAENQELRDAFLDHLDVTKRHVERLEEIFGRLSMSEQEEETCEAMQGLIEEVQEVISGFEAGPIRDSALIIGAQKIEHYEIAAYGSLRELAEVLGYRKTADLLDRTLEEEAKTDRHLTVIARDVNDEALELTEEAEESM